MNRTLQEAMLAYNFHLVPHAHGKTLLDHSVNVGKLLLAWGGKDHVVLSAYFHSAYGREVTTFAPVSLNQRQHIKDLIGHDAEELAYLNCAMQTESFWANFHSNFNAPKLIDRFLNSTILVSRQQLIEIFQLNFANMIDHLNPHDAHDPSFRWAEISLYVQYYDYLSESQRQVFKRSFFLEN